MKKVLSLFLFACLTALTALAATVTPVTLEAAIADGTVVNLCIDGKYLYGPNAQNTAMGDADAAASSANGCVGYKIEKDGDNYMFRCVTPAGGDYKIWGRTEPNYLNAQPAVGGVTFNLNNGTQKGTDMPNGAVWTIEADGSIKNVGNGGYFAGTSTSAEPVAVTFVTIKADPEPEPEKITVPAALQAFIANKTIFTLKSGDNYVYGPTNQDIAVGTWEQASAETNNVQGYILENDDYYYYLRAVKADGADLTIYGKNPCFLNTNGATIVFNLGKDQDVKNGSSWLIEEVDGKYALKNVASKAYLGINGAACNTTAEATSTWELYVPQAVDPSDDPVVNTELVNGGFDTEADWATANVSPGDKNKNAASGWTINASAEWAAISTFAYGSEVLLNNAAVPAADAKGATEGGLMGVAASWGNKAAYEQAITLLAGTYELSYEAYEANPNFNKGIAKNLIGFIADNGTEYLSTKTAYTLNEWTSEKIIITLAEETTGKLSVGYASANLTSNVTPKLFVDNIAITAIDPVAAVKEQAIAALPAVISGSIFSPSAEQVETVKAAIEAAATVEEVEAAANAEWAIPALNGTYNVLNTTANNYLGEAVLSAEAVDVVFEAADGGFYMKANGKYINMVGNNTWSMEASEEAKTAWKFNLTDGNYTIQGPNGLIGSDNADAGSAVYGNKTVAKNGVWTIIEKKPAKPANLSLTLTPTAVTTIDAADANVDTNYYNAEATSWLVSQGALTGTALKDFNLPYLIMKFDLSEFEGYNIQKAQMSYDSKCTVSGKNSNVELAIVSPEWDPATVTWTSFAANANATQISEGTGQNVKTSTVNLKENVLNFIKDEAGKNVAFAIYTYTAREQQISNIQLEIEAVNASASSEVKISYVCDGNEVKTDKVTGVTGEKVELFAAQKADFYDADKTKKYIYVSDNAEETVVANEGTVITVNVREAAVYNYSILSSQGGVVAKSSGFEGEKVDAGYPRYQLIDGVLYEAPKTNNNKKEYRTTVDLAADNAEQTITYNQVKENVAFYAEAEDVEGLTTVTYGNVAVRASNALAAKAVENTVITTLPAGKYQVAAGVFTSSSSPAFEIKIAIGDAVYSAPVKAVNNSEVTSEEYNVAEGTAVTLLAEGMTDNNSLDYIYIIKTGEYEGPATATYAVSATSADDAQGTAKVSATEAVAAGTEVTATAEAAEGFEFVNWTVNGEEVSAENPYTFAVSADVALVANFKATADPEPDTTYPKDMTDKMVNAVCAGVQGTAGAEGWTITGNGNPPYRYGNFFENWNGTPANAKFDYYQVVTGLPTGKYTVSAEIQYDGAAGDNEVGAYASTSADEVHGGNKAQTTGFNEYTTPEIIVTDGTLRIGLKTLATQTAMWTAARNFKLTMTGELSLDDFKKMYETAKAQITEELLDTMMNFQIRMELMALNEAAEPTTQEGYISAINTINDKVAEANKSAKFYNDFDKKFTEIGKVELDEAGEAAALAYPGMGEAIAAWATGSLDETFDYISLLDSAIITGVKSQGAGADMTLAMPANWVGATGKYANMGVPERWNAQAYTGDVMTQTIDGLQAGEYQVTLKLAASTTKSRDGEAAGNVASTDEAATVMFANDATKGIEVVERLDVTAEEFNEYEITATVGEDCVLTYGLKNNAVAGNWFVIQGVKLVYVSAPKDDPTAVNGVAEAAANAGVKKVAKDGKIIIVKDGKEISAAGAIMK